MTGDWKSRGLVERRFFFFLQKVLGMANVAGILGPR